MLPSSFQLEEDFHEPYKSWKADPTPANMTKLVNAVTPAITSSIKTHVGSAPPSLVSHGKQIFIKSINDYDPQQGRLKPFIHSQLQGVRRVNRQQTSPVRVPERMVMDSYSLDKHENDLAEELGRLPSTQELSDHMRMSPERIAAIRRYRTPIAEGQVVDPETGASGYTGNVTNPTNDAGRVWRELVYQDLPPREQFIMERTMGMYGHKPMSNHEIAARMKLTPGAISQIKAKIQTLLDQESDLSPFGQ